MSDARRKRLVVAMVWLGLVLAGAIAYKMLFAQSEDELLDDTSSASRYKHTVTVAADLFSGYAVLRSDTMQGALRKSGIKLKVVDDQADLLPPVDLVLRDADQRHGVALVDVVVPVVRASRYHLYFFHIYQNAAARRRSTLMMIF